MPQGAAACSCLLLAARAESAPRRQLSDSSMLRAPLERQDLLPYALATGTWVAHSANYATPCAAATGFTSPASRSRSARIYAVAKWLYPSVWLGLLRPRIS